MFGVRYDPEESLLTPALNHNGRFLSNLRKRKRRVQDHDVDDDVVVDNDKDEEETNKEKKEEDEEKEEEEETDNKSESESENDVDGKHMKEGLEDKDDAMEVDTIIEDNEFSGKHKSIFDKFKLSVTRTVNDDVVHSSRDEEEDFQKQSGNREEEKGGGGEEEEVVETQDLAPLPQPQLPRDRKLNSSNQHSANLDWLTTPEYIAIADTKPFSEFPLSPFMHDNLESLGFENAFAVQVGVLSKLLPEIQANKLRPDAFGDVLVNASTGSGKTLAYSIPIIESLKDRVVPRVRAIVLVPTKPLINQVRATMLQLALGTNLNIVSLKNDISIREESERLIELVPDVVISTPGRLVEHLAMDSISLSSLRYLVVDEADRLLNQSFQNWSQILISKIHLQQVYDVANVWSLKVQKFIFSATLTTDAGKLASLDFHNPRLLIVNDSQRLVNELFSVPATLSEYKLNFGVAKSSLKPLILAKFLIAQEKLSDVLVFTKSNESSIRLCTLLQAIFDRICLQEKVKVGFMNLTNNRTSLRSKILKDFTSQKINILVATDLIARGLDVTSIKDVVNYDLLNSSREYVHRVGRTARANQAGNAYNLVFGKGEEKWFKTISSEVSRNNDVKDVEVNLKQLISDEDERLYQEALQSLQDQVRK